MCAKSHSGENSIFTQEVNLIRNVGLANWEIRPWVMKKKRKSATISNHHVFLQYQYNHECLNSICIHNQAQRFLFDFIKTFLFLNLRLERIKNNESNILILQKRILIFQCKCIRPKHYSSTIKMKEMKLHIPWRYNAIILLMLWSLLFHTCYAQETETTIEDIEDRYVQISYALYGLFDKMLKF